MFRTALAVVALAVPLLRADDPPEVVAPPRVAKGLLSADALKALTPRGLGPAITPGRIGDIAVDPRDSNVWYVAHASGGLWKTTNRGLTWAPIFDQYGAYSLGCVVLDPKNPSVVWLGTGENQSQRSVGFGDGVYKSTDAGKTWANVGLKNSEHIAKVLIHPKDSDTVYVAAQGPLWSPGGDRGLYKTTDGGKTWKPVLTVDENTGVTDAAFDPRDPDTLYAATYQRRRNVGVVIGGGPGCGVHKSTDGGKTWKKLTKGFPETNVGRIAIAVSPQKPDVLYAHIQRAVKDAGFYKSTDGGQSWTKGATAQVQDGQYYGEIFCDPKVFDRVYVMDMTVQVTDDGGKTFRRMAWNTHVDHHALWFDPADANHWLSGNDGGIYESHDAGKTWRHFDNLPTQQFYRVAVDNAVPFYNVYGGMQDNGTVGGPVRGKNRVGVRTADWGVFGGGDGMQPLVAPDDPDIVYTQSQNGALVRLDKKTGNARGIRPREQGVRWHWDSPLIASPHNPKRIYFGGSKLFRSDDRGDTWKAISPDLTRQLDPLKVPVMGKVWGKDEAVSQNTFTTPLSVLNFISESPLKEGLLYVCTDDGLIQVSSDGGTKWRKFDKFPGVPAGAYVSAVVASHHDADTVYATFNNYQAGDFKPYVLRSRDRGETWASVAGDLPTRHPVWSLVEDHVNKDLLFAGTEFGLFVTVDGGRHWVKFGGVPTVQFRDLVVQKREGDLVAATFGRGFFVLDDYAPLRYLTEESAAQEGVLFPVRPTRAFAEVSFARTGGEFAAPNPPPGALVTYHLREAAKSDARVSVRITDAAGRLVREVTGPTAAGIHRVNWDLRVQAAPAPKGGGGGGFGGGRGAGGDLAKPGKYTATLVKVVGKAETVLGKQTFDVIPEAPVAAQP